MTGLHREYLYSLFTFASHCIPISEVGSVEVVPLLHVYFRCNIRMEASQTNSSISTEAVAFAFSMEIEAALFISLARL